MIRIVNVALLIWIIATILTGCADVSSAPSYEQPTADVGSQADAGAPATRIVTGAGPCGCRYFENNPTAAAESAGSCDGHTMLYIEPVSTMPGTAMLACVTVHAVGDVCTCNGQAGSVEIVEGYMCRAADGSVCEL